MRQTIPTINMAAAREGMALMNKFFFAYIKEHGMEYYQAHIKEYEEEETAYVKAHRTIH